MSITPLKSQIVGASLALATAIGCIFYEKLCQTFSYFTVLCIYFFELALLLLFAYFYWKPDLRNDLQMFRSDWKWVWYSVFYVSTGVTGIFWYTLTKNQGVMVGSLYEVKYIVMLALIYIVFGQDKFTWNTGIGVCLALGSIYFISKS